MWSSDWIEPVKHTDKMSQPAENMDPATHDTGAQHAPALTGMTMYVSDDEVSRAKATRELQSTVPQNEFGLPIGIYRADLLPFDQYVPPTRDNPVLSLVPAVQNSPNRPLNGKHYRSPQPLIDPKTEPLDREEQDEEGDLLPGEQRIDRKEPDDFLNSLNDGHAEDIIFAPADHKQEPLQVRAPTSDVQYAVDDRVAGFPRGMVAQAYMPLSFDEGIPTLPSGNTLWDQWPHEPVNAYTALAFFLQMPLVDASGVRVLADLPTMLVHNRIIAAETPEVMRAIQTYYNMYGWGMRARAFDMFRVVKARKRQEERALATQDEHYILSRQLMSKLRVKLFEEDFWDMLTPKTAIDMLKTITSLERVSAGLPGGAPADVKKTGDAGVSVEVAMRTMAGDQSAVVSEQHSNDAVTQRLYSDPKALELAQQLIIRVKVPQQ